MWRHVRATKRSCRLAGGLVRGWGESAPEPAAVVNRQGFSVAPTIVSDGGGNTVSRVCEYLHRARAFAVLTRFVSEMCM